ncbi:MAG: 50S ribosomal protein L21, partial [Desulfovibrionaceae bacterium]|nr:50S ribosomal protein L21 [Desulfovibrionaceae bacterium]
KQYRVEEGSKIIVEKLPQETGATITLDHVLMLGGEECKIGTPYIEGSTVTAEIVEQGRGPRIRVFKRWRRNDSRCLNGHRQYLTTLNIKSIQA